MTQSPREITAAIASGDTEAFACFYRRWFDQVLAEARRATGRDEQFCLDIVQESMMTVIRCIKPMESDAQIAGWLRTVVYSRCLDALRQEQRRRARERAAAQCMPTHSNDSLNERLDWLRTQLARLDGDEVQLLSLRYRLEWTLQRIASSLGLKTGAVDGRISRSLARLREQAPESFNE